MNARMDPIGVCFEVRFVIGKKKNPGKKNPVAVMVTTVVSVAVTVTTVVTVVLTVTVALPGIMVVVSVAVILGAAAMLNPASFPRQKRCWLTMWCHPWLSW